MQQEYVNLNQLVADELESSRQTFSEKVTVDFMSEESLKNVYADPTHLRQVLTFVFAKAKKAMPNGGELTLLTRNVKRNPFIPEPASTSGGDNYVMLSVTNTGDVTDDSGIDSIFESSTFSGGHELSGGSELALVNSIIKKYNGGLEVRSKTGEGTTFQVFFPSSRDARD